MLWKFRLLLKVLIVWLSGAFPGLLSDEKYSQILYFIVFGRLIDIHHPKTFNENIIARKLENKKYDYAKYTDKYEVRKYVKACIGDEILIPILGIYSSFDEINFDELPSAFVLKATHASGFNIIVPDKRDLDIQAVKRRFDKWLGINFYYKDREKNYRDIVPRILCDEYIRFDKALVEYKLYCFKGKVKLICQNIDQDGRRFTNVYNQKFIEIPVRFGYDRFSYPITEEKTQLISIAEKLAKPFEFVRVDLYENSGKILFSELTFHSGGGLVPFIPAKYDTIFGEFFMNGAEL